MTALLTWLLGNPALMALAAGVLSALGWGYAQRRAGAAQERQRQAEEGGKARDTAARIDDVIAGRDAASNRERLSRWSPKP